MNFLDRLASSKAALLASMLALVAGSCGDKPAPKSPIDPQPMVDNATPLSAPTEKPMSASPSRPWPTTKRQDIADTIHGKQVADPYRWLEDEKAPEVVAWMNQQDNYARGELAKLPTRAALATRLKEVFYYDAISAPQHYGGRFFYTRKLASKEKSIVYWKQGESGVEQVLLDPNTMSADGTTGLGGWWPSYDGKLVAYAIKENNADETTHYVMDVATGKKMADKIDGTKYSGASWTPDNKGFYYTWVPPVSDQVAVADRPGFAEVKFHKLGDDPAKDRIVHPATKNAETFIGGGVSRDGHWLTVSIQHGWNSTDLYFKDARKPAAPWTTLIAGTDSNYDVTIWKDVFYVNTNEGAPRSRMFRVDPKKPARANWKEIVPQSEATLQSADVVGNHLVLSYLSNAANKVQIHDLNGKMVRALDIPALGSTGGMVGNPDEDTGYLSFTSFTEPSIIFKTSIKSGAASEWARIKLPIDTSAFETEQVFYPSKDGTKISMFLVRKKGATKNKTNPTILYGYGGFNVSLTPGFSSSRAVWMENGGMIAIPNLRGGGEYGEDWHKAGMKLNKQNVFDDFIAAAQFLISEGWTTPAHLAIQGGSNGGLLVGATMTQAPELFKAVICAVPLLDMIRFHLSGSGKTWVPEYGSAEDAKEFAAIWGYSPYRRAVDEGARKYPALLMDSADHDDRVDPAHARKLAAQIQFAQSGDAPVLLRIEKNSGHGGADNVKQAVERTADQWAFLLDQLK
jgi:prolyl oligopeptidase